MTPRAAKWSGADEVMAGLKDFQRDTVEYVFDRLFTAEAPARRFLVADEVGLGKTLVARGVVAKAIEHLQEKVRRVDVIYICSNAEIARQNISRLNVTRDTDFQLASRITLLPLRLKDLTKRRLNFASFTPGTSFDLRSNMGVSDERIVLYWLLHRAWGAPALRGQAPLKILRGGAGLARFGQRVGWFEPDQLDRGLADGFTRALREEARLAKAEGRASLRQRFSELCDRVRHRRREMTAADARERSAIIGELRALLARTCVEALEPDLVILDEFQRFRSLLDGDGPAAQLAGHLFDYPDAHVLLLSATPYKMVTFADDAGGEDHHRDFQRTLGFLLGQEGATEVADELRRFRRELLSPDGLDRVAARQRREAAEALVRPVMCRTERLAVKADRNGMLADRVLGDLRLEPGDVERFVALDRLAVELDAGDMVEYWKSAPYLPNFMDGYQLVHRLAAGRGRSASPEVAALLAEAGGLLDWEDIAAYRRVDPGNTRLRALTKDVLGREMWRWLWLPPALPYYTPADPYDRDPDARATKRLVFSSWAVVPKVISALLSYEAERRMMSEGSPPPPNTTEDRRRLGQLLRFTRSKERRASSTSSGLGGMKVFALLYPSTALARIGDPLAAALGAGGLVNREELLADVHRRLEHVLGPWLELAGHGGSVDDTWYWAVPLLTELGDPDSPAELTWFENAYEDLWTGGVADDETGRERGDESRSSFGEHIDEAWSLMEAVRSGEVELGRPPPDLVKVASLMAVAGPAVCALRALTRACGPEQLDEEAVRSGAARVAWGFRSLFNLPEVTALVKGSHPDDAYWRAVLDYCVAGNLQAVLDEFAHVLPDRLGLLDPAAPATAGLLADAMRDALTLRTTTYKCHDLETNGGGVRFHQGAHSLRGRFALRFGQDRPEEVEGLTAAGQPSPAVRATQLRDAFNSPFWPFVLATTSVGQEGLDFHQYCHACVHWNLPANPVDLEQREGRVHRYKGHAVRKNVADAHQAVAFANGQDPWSALFAAAVAARPPDSNDLEPYWVYPGEHRIERIVPVLPLSREVGRLAALRRGVAAYRLIIGQPRQDDLLEWLTSRFSEEELKGLLDELCIDLTPPSLRQGSASGP